MYKLKKWIDINKINWTWLSMNPNAIHFLENNSDKIVGMHYLQIQMRYIF